MIKRTICSHPDAVPELRAMIEQNEMEAYVLPQGVLQQLYRCCANKQPGLLTKIGIGTYIDPRLEGGKINSITTEDIVEVVEVNGEEYLFFKSFPVTVAIIRGSTADENGNVTIEREALRLEILEIALAAKAHNGKVIVQVGKSRRGRLRKQRTWLFPANLWMPSWCAKMRASTIYRSKGRSIIRI
jgi:propionate CoA-transferase